MSRRNGTVEVVRIVWILAVAAGSIASYTGNATPYVEPTQLPGGGTADAGIYMFGTILVVGFGGAVVIGLVAGDQWQKMKEETDLTLTDSGVTGRGTYAGTINGREVRARTERRTTGSDTEGGSNKTTYTITEADLDSALNEGILFRRVTDSEHRMDMSDSSTKQVVINDEFVLTGIESEQVARETLTREVREAVRAVEDSETITIGEASEVIADELPGLGDSMVGGFVEDKMRQAMTKGVGGSPTTVGIETEGVVGDAKELDSRIAAVAAVADAFESARQTE